MVSQRMDEIEDWLDIPWSAARYQGEGLNCWELVSGVLQYVYNKEPPGIQHKGNIKFAEATFNKWMLEFDEVLMPQPGDVVVFLFDDQPRHCGVFVGDNKFLHVIEGRRSCIERLESPYWFKRTEGFYRWKH